jgi:hypothetical protein
MFFVAFTFRSRCARGLRSDANLIDVVVVVVVVVVIVVDGVVVTCDGNCCYCFWARPRESFLDRFKRKYDPRTKEDRFDS